MRYFKPKFWLGMTASPDTNQYDIYSIFDHHIAYEIRLQQALEEDLLCPFHYFGITDLEIDGKVFDDSAGVKNFSNLISDARVDYVIDKANYYGFSGDRVKGLIFCSRKDEAKELSKKFNERGLRTEVLTGEDDQARRETVIARLTDNEDVDNQLDYIFTVDIFNEGVDIPEINQVIMLRPTQSPVVFIQQLGRGLRKYEGKEYVVILDFIGNYMNNFMIPIALSGDRSYNKDAIQIMKDYMASGSFARGKEEKAASASMAFVGNINQSVDVLLKTSSLFDPFPPEMGTDTAFLDRIHCYIPGWEIPKFRPEHFTDDYGFITDYLAEFLRELRKEQYGDALDKYFRLGKNLNQRDTIAVRKMVGGFVKLLYPDGEFTKEQLEEILQISLEMRRRVKEQLKKLGGMEFYDVNFSYIDSETFEEHYVSVPEQGGGKLIPEGMCNPGQVYTVSRGKSGMIGVFRLESQMLPGNGKIDRTGLGSDRDAKEATDTAFKYLKANGSRISGTLSTTMKDYIINYQDLQGIGMTSKLALPTLIALCSIALGKPTVSTLAVLGEISISGTMIKVDDLANVLQVCLDSGAKKILLPITSAGDLGSVPAELMGSFNIIFYNSAEDAVFKALGVE